MNSVEAKLLEEFKSRHSSDHGHETWIQTAESFLDESLPSQKRNYEKAASLLAASGWSREGLNMLAYASFCFWHRPLAIPKEAFKPSEDKEQKRRGVSWIANDLMKKLACLKDLSQDEQKVWDDVNGLLALACVALKAISLREITTRGNAWSFQARMLQILPERLANDPYFIEKNEEWPDYLGYCRKNKLDPKHPASFQEAFEKTNPQEVSKKAAAVFCETASADKLFSDNFGGVSAVSAFYPKDGKGSAGCYRYSEEERYLILPDTFWDCMQTLPAFIAFTAHEVLHMHQMRSMEIKPDPSSPFYAEYLINHGILRAVDCPCDTYSIQGKRARNAKLPTDAYLYRPKEFLAYQFDGAFQKVLAKKLGTHFVKPGCNTGYDEFAKAAGVEVEPDQPERPKILLANNLSSHLHCQRQRNG